MSNAQLRAFHAVAREGSYTAAARALGASQSNLSGHVKALETAYGVRLFERQGRGVRITDLGRQLFAVTDRLFAVEAEAVVLLGGGRATRVARLSVSADAAHHALPVLAEFKKRHPHAALSLRIGNSEQVLRDLIDHRADVGVTALAPEDPRLFGFRFRRDRLVLFVPRSHPWAKRRSVPFIDLAGQAVVLREMGSVTRAVFDRALAGAGIRLAESLSIESREAVREAVAAGFGVGVGFAREVPPDERLAVLAVPDAPFEVAEYVACHADRKTLPPIRLYLDIARALADS